MRRTIPLILVALAGCTGTPFHARSQLFAAYSQNTNTQGRGYLLLVNDKLECSDFKDRLTAGDLWLKVDGMDGVLFYLTYDLAKPPNGNSWVGDYAASGTLPGEGPNNEASSRSVQSSWFTADGFWMADSSGLQLHVEKVKSDKVVGSYEHVWGSGPFSADDCGSYSGSSNYVSGGRDSGY